MSNTTGTKRQFNLEDNQAVASTSNLESHNIINENVEITTDHTYGKRHKKDMGSSSVIITLPQETLRVKRN
ncbi:hypothetical protein FQA39_LY14196 [Lamprigera yunnana]|nr:hypothetical protein FQA39_LY14196 [Lamprigera yunnana]